MRTKMENKSESNNNMHKVYSILKASIKKDFKTPPLYCSKEYKDF